MRLYLKDTKLENFLRFLILDELGNEKYKVSVEHTSLAVKIDVYNMDNKRVAKIRKRDLMSFNTYTVSCRENKIKVIANLSKSIPIFYINGISWYFRGDILTKNFDVINVDKSVVMSHSFNFNDFDKGYILNIEEKNKELLCVCISLCIDTMAINIEKEKLTNKKSEVKNCLDVT